MRSRGAAISAYYFWLFGALGLFWPFFSLYLKSVGLAPAEITRIIGIIPVATVVAPPLLGLVADAWRARGLLLRVLTVMTALWFPLLLWAGGARLAIVCVTAA